MHPDLAIARFASAQGGNVTTAQLRAAGLDRGGIARRVRNGRLHPKHRGVFLVGHEAEAENSVEWAATLACGDGAVVCDRSAVGVFGLLARQPGADVDISIPSRSRRRHKGIRVHRTPTLRREDTGYWNGLPITTPARTLLDFAAHAEPRELERATSEALIQKLVTTRKLAAVLERYPNHPGGPTLKALLTAGPKRVHEGVEELLLTKLRKARTKQPDVNQRLHGWEVDFLWRDERLVVETDSARFHGVPSAVNRDRRKDADLRAHGYTVLRYSWAQVTSEPEFVIAEIATSIAAPRP